MNKNSQSRLNKGRMYLVKKSKCIENENRSEPIIAHGSGYIIRIDSIVYKEGVTIEEITAAFPFFKKTGWALMCINIDGECDGFGYRFITYQIKAKLGKYLKSWVSYEMYPNAKAPSFPSWLDVEYNPNTGFYYIYGCK
jgi:hypothetical protein